MNRLAGFGRSRKGRWALAAGVVVALLVGLSAPAYAHHANLSGQTYCANNDHVVTWSIGNSQSNLPMTIDSATATINGDDYAVTGYTNPVPNSGTTNATSVVPGPVQGSLVLTVNVSWPNGVTWQGSATVALEGTCGCTCTSTSSTTSTTEPTTTTTEPTTTTTEHHCGCSTTTTEPTTTTTEATTTTTEATTTTTEATTTTTEATTTTTEPTTTSTESLGSTTIVTTTTLGHQGSTTPTTAKSTTTVTTPPVEGDLPFTGSGTSIPVIFGLGALLLGAALAFRKRGAWTR